MDLDAREVSSVALKGLAERELGGLVYTLYIPYGLFP